MSLKKQNILTGVPQGSILDPISFLIYDNDSLLTFTNTEMDLYIDDSTLCKSGNNNAEVQRFLQADVQSIEDWYQFNNMTIKPK